MILNNINRVFSSIMRGNTQKSEPKSYNGLLSNTNLFSWYDEISQNPIVYRCIKLISQNIGSIPISVGGDYLNVEIFKRPNPEDDMTHFLEKIICNLMVEGNAYVLGMFAEDESIESMHIVNPKKIKVLRNEFDMKIGYCYRTSKGLKNELIDKNGKCKILHIQYMGPFGNESSPCKIVGKSVHLYNSITQHNQSLMDNAARFGGALIVNNRLTQDQGEKLRQEIDSRLGYKNAGYVPILQGEMRWEDMKANVKDCDYTEGQVFVAREIMQIFGVPPTMLGISDASFNHYKEARLHFWEDTLLPLAKYIVSSFEKWINDFGNDCKLELDLKDIPAFADKMDKRINALANASFISNEEKREMCGLKNANNI